jgi:hypothetical protein
MNPEQHIARTRQIRFGKRWPYRSTRRNRFSYSRKLSSSIIGNVLDWIWQAVSVPNQPWGHESYTRDLMNPGEASLFESPALDVSSGTYCSSPVHAFFVSMQLRAAMKKSKLVLQPKSATRAYMRTSDADFTSGSWSMMSRDCTGGEALGFQWPM